MNEVQFLQISIYLRPVCAVTGVLAPGRRKPSTLQILQIAIYLRPTGAVVGEKLVTLHGETPAVLQSANIPKACPCSDRREVPSDRQHSAVRILQSAKLPKAYSIPTGRYASPSSSPQGSPAGL